MTGISILNDVLGPVMRGPSSSHTAGSYHLAALARGLLGEPVAAGGFFFSATGSYGQVYHEQGSDLAFATGLLNWPITDDRFPWALELAAAGGLRLDFRTGEWPEADHPNQVRIKLTGQAGGQLQLEGKSTGGGSVEIGMMEGWPVRLTGETWVVAVESAGLPAGLDSLLRTDGQALGPPQCQEQEGKYLTVMNRAAPLMQGVRARLARCGGVSRIFEAAPLALVKRGRPVFDSAAALLRLAEEKGISAGDAGLLHEAQLLGMTGPEVLAEMKKRLAIMWKAVLDGLDGKAAPMKLLLPSADRIFQAEQKGHLAAGGLHTRAAVRAMAAMHVNCGQGVVCAAPTAGSAGVLPAVAVTLLEEKDLDEDTVARALLAAGAIGVVVAGRATFAAEVAGCQVEIGAAGAMAAAAVVEAAGGTARQAADAAAICFQNTMGSVCDLVQGIVEIPCHTRNAVAAASAFVVADLVLGGYENPIPLDETIDAVYATGRMMPPELRVTSLGGLAVTPSALALKRQS